MQNEKTFDNRYDYVTLMWKRNFDTKMINLMISAGSEIILKNVA